MFERLAETVHGEVSVNDALLHTHEINKLEWRYSYHNFRKSAAYCARALKDAGAQDVEVIPYPADGVTSYMDCIMPMAWDVKGARLEIVSPAGASPRVLADWDEDPFTIGMWSPPTKPGGVTAEVVTEENMRAGADVRGKIVLNAITYHPRQIKKEVGKRGGIGVVSDWTEHYLDTPDGIYWNNEWSQTISGWYGGTREDAEESPIWCLSMTPRTGSYLRGLMRRSKRPVRLRATVDTRLYDGVLDVVTGTIPGRSKDADEVLLLAHIYEPMPADDASGGAAIIEMLRTLRSLIDTGKLPPSERTIRVLLNQERYGSSAYYATHPKVRARTIVGTYLDEPCYDQTREGRPIDVHMNPDHQACFSDVLITDMVRHCFAAYAPIHTWKPAGWGGGDTALTDSTVGIPMNWITCAVSRYHHNSVISDFSTLDPVFFHVNMTINATFAYFAASAGPKEAAWLGFRIASEAQRTMTDEIDKELASCLSQKKPDVAQVLERVRGRLAYQKLLTTKRLAGLKRLVGKGDAEARKCVARLSREVAGMATAGVRVAEQRLKVLRPDCRKRAKARARRLSKAERQARGMVPKRKALGLPCQYASAPRAKRRELWGKQKVDALVWADGKRNLLEIIRLIEAERELAITDVAGYIAYFKAMARYGYVEIV